MNEKIIDLNELFSKMDLDNSEFLNFFDLRHLQAGILRLKPGERDTQEPHSSDEIYLVLEGNGFIEIEVKLKPVKKADFIFVSANIQHRFIVDDEDLVVIYFFPS